MVIFGEPSELHSAEASFSVTECMCVNDVLEHIRLSVNIMIQYQ